MNATRPIYIKLLILAIVVYVIGVTFILSDIYFKVGRIEHVLSHASSGHDHQH